MNQSPLAALPVLQTDRLTLRAFNEADFDALRVLESDREVFRYRTRRDITPAVTRARLQLLIDDAHNPERHQFGFAIVRLSDEHFMGECGLTLLQDASAAAFLWYSMIRSFWGNGYATEAAQAVVEFELYTMGLDRIEASFHVDNNASRRVLEKFGMRPLPGDYIQGASHDRMAIQRIEANAYDRNPVD